MKDTNHRFKINTDNYGTSKRESVLNQVRHHFEAYDPTVLGLVWELSSRNHALDSLGVNKSSKVMRFAFRKLKYPADTLDKLIYTLRNDRNNRVRFTPNKIPTNINTRINEKIIIEEIDDGVI